MVSLTSLIIPILVSSVVVFVASSIIHMVLPYHRSDVRKLPAAKEDELLEALRRINLAPGEYAAPHAGSMAGMKDPAFLAKVTKGPLAFMTLSPGGSVSMGNSLRLWFVYIVVVSIFAAYLTSRALATGSDYLAVFRFIGTTAFMGYSLALLHESIWYRRAWTRTFKSMFDGLVYALLSAGVFGWLWPRG
ncbi:MAG: hypothetical protein ND807_10410 [Vicinamibacterales bacterium]|nr:hypothetical protein [Vicinamibacterales bacterium]